LCVKVSDSNHISNAFSRGCGAGAVRPAPLGWLPGFYQIFFKGNAFQAIENGVSYYRESTVGTCRWNHGQFEKGARHEPTQA
jgi:hypothetical protein